jgi:hypothetical protein
MRLFVLFLLVVFAALGWKYPPAHGSGRGAGPRPGSRFRTRVVE